MGRHCGRFPGHGMQHLFFCTVVLLPSSGHHLCPESYDVFTGLIFLIRWCARSVNGLPCIEGTGVSALVRGDPLPRSLVLHSSRQTFNYRSPPSRS